MFRISIDVGGTFTDLVAFNEDTGEIYNIKIPTIPRNLDKGILIALKKFLAGNPNERIKMVDKRNAKLKQMRDEMQAPEVYFGDSDVLLVGWGATQGAIQEAVDILRSDGNNVGSVTFADLWPFPAQLATEALTMARSFFLVEQNNGSQLGQLIKLQTGLQASGAILKYDGRPFFPIEIVNDIKQSLR